MSWLGKLMGNFTAWQAGRRDMAELLDALDTSGQVVADRFARAGDNANNCEVARHIIGIERWSRRRLQTALGDTALNDDYDAYRPDDVADMAALSALFAAEREKTIALAQQAANLPDSVRVAHNDLGEMSVAGWLFYIENHASRECIRLRG